MLFRDKLVLPWLTSGGVDTSPLNHKGILILPQDAAGFGDLTFDLFHGFIPTLLPICYCGFVDVASRLPGGQVAAASLSIDFSPGHLLLVLAFCKDGQEWVPGGVVDETLLC